MSYPIKSPRKLIEVALPLDAINAAAAKEKSIRHGHPSTLHLWWARRPLAAARAVIFAQLVNDPGYQQGGGFKYGKNKKEAAIERKRLFKIIEDLVLWENTTNEEVLKPARAEIRRSWREVCDLNKDHPQAAEMFNPEKLPAVHDPFAGGGAIPLEAQRLGLEAIASDLNPVAVIINKATIEIPPKFAGQAPVSRVHEKKQKNKELGLSQSWRGATGLAEDVRYYGSWIREQAKERIGDLYPAIEITAEMAHQRADLKELVGQKLTVIAWLWTRTVKCLNPACGARMPMVGSFYLSEKAGKEVFAEPVLNLQNKSLYFDVKTSGKPRSGTTDKTAAECLFCGTKIRKPELRDQAMNYGVGEIPLAIVCDGPKGRVYLPFRSMDMPHVTRPKDSALDVPMPNDRRWFSPPLYGLPNFSDLFTPRQLVMLTTFSDLVSEVRERIRQDALVAGMPDDAQGIELGGCGAKAYAESVAMYLGMCVSKLTAYHCTLAIWRAPEGKTGRAFGRQAIPMVWDFPECNPFAAAGGDWDGAVTDCGKVLSSLTTTTPGIVGQFAAQQQRIVSSPAPVVCTDPPYYDNVGYADLSDFFYIWIRRALRPLFPTLLSTITVPKAEELVATPYRHGGKAQAEAFFLSGMTEAMSNLASRSRADAPTAIYYAFKQAESSADGTSSTGWETFLDAVLRAGFSITGTWPMRTEQSAALKANINSLASSIVLVCRKRPIDAITVSRREFIRELNGMLPEALDEMTKGSGDDRSPVAPVDLSQAIIGPGMAVFSKYSAVLEADGSPMSVRTALQLINRFLAEDDFDHDTQFCLHWFEQHGWGEAAFGEADTLARAKGTSVDGVRDAGVIRSGSGKVSLLKWSDYPTDWDPRTDKRMPVWEALHHLIRALRQGGDSASGALLAGLGGKAEAVRQLAYRLYTLCERLGQAEDARAYNELITSWTGIESAAATAPPTQKQGEMF